MGDSGQYERKWAESSLWLAQAKPQYLLQLTENLVRKPKGKPLCCGAFFPIKELEHCLDELFN